jgi:hypothetical protein
MHGIKYLRRFPAPNPRGEHTRLACSGRRPAEHPLGCSAGWRPAVSPTGSRQGVTTVGGVRIFQIIFFKLGRI